MSDLVHPGEIPVLAADLSTLEQTVGDLSRAGAATYRRGETVRTTYLSLGDHYDAPEAPELLGSIASVGSLNEELHDATAGAAQHLERYVEQARSLARSLTGLRERAELLQNAADPADVTASQRAESEAIRGALRTALTDYHATETHAARAIADLLATHSGTAVLERAAALSGAERAVALMRQDDLTEGELAELDRLLATHGENDHFAGYLLDTLGVAELARQSARFENVDYLSTAPSSPEDPFPVNSLVVGLANVFATATRTPERLKDAPPESAEFTEWLRTPEGRDWQRRTDAARAFAAGPEDQGLLVDVRQYGPLLDLMEPASVPYSPQFLDGLVADMSNGPSGSSYEEIRSAGERRDLDRLLGISSRNPDAAAMIVDPDRNSRAKDWIEQVGQTDLLSPIRGEPDPELTKGLNQFLGAAATGMIEGTEPTPDAAQPSAKNAQIAQLVIDQAAKKEGFPPPLAQALGNTTALYLGDFNDAMNGGVLPLFENGLDLDYSKAISVLEENGKNEESFEIVRQAQIAYAGATFTYLLSDEVDFEKVTPIEAAELASQAGGQAMGALTSTRSDAVFTENTKSLDNGFKRLSQHFLTSVTDSTVGRFPGAGTAAGNEMIRVNESLWREHDRKLLQEAKDQREAIRGSTRDQVSVAYSDVMDSATASLRYTEDDRKHYRDAASLGARSGFNETSAEYNSKNKN
ncbi:hypothetical protein [Streptomyces spiramenti]|uniref:Uncharacterized protein n=1 Tax=Streptomyces spiramenti TaxID=2720606 RepID=A0ABX1ADC0_9ACTN|nr:hypothetical protein [Streptomyces spiramenti]NJP65114.1 hypothetical protein [Streptomyces spiramenti]